jgi:oligopeptidase B
MKRIYASLSKGTQVEAPYNTPVPNKVPISVIYRTDLFKGNGTNPCLLYGYGSYGISIDPEWSYYRFSLLDRGFVYAIAHIRGGGDCGRGWYETGKFKNKMNTFYDFIACSEELVNQKLTSHQLTAIEGRSAGGMLIGSVINLRPDIAGVAVAGVPFVDVVNTSNFSRSYKGLYSNHPKLVMDPSIPLTVNEYEEWGNPNEKDFFDYMMKYSPYDNINMKVQVCV